MPLHDLGREVLKSEGSGERRAHGVEVGAEGVGLWCQCTAYEDAGSLPWWARVKVGKEEGRGEVCMGRRVQSPAVRPITSRL